MALEELVKNDKAVKYSSSAFARATEGKEKLDRADIYTTEGLDEFKSTAGYDLSEKNPEEAEYISDAIKKGYAGDYENYVSSHVPKLFGELSEESQFNFAFNYIPEKTLKDRELEEKRMSGEEVEDKYEPVRQEASKKSQTLKMITRKPGEFLKETIDEFSKEGLLGNYIIRKIQQDPRQYIEIKKGVASKDLGRVLSDYGVDDFFSDTYERLSQAKEEADKELEPIQKEKQEFLKDAQTKGYNTSEIAKGLKDIEEKNKSKIEKMKNEYSDIGMLQSIREEIKMPAYQAIKGKEEEKKRKEEEEERRAEGN